MPRKSKAEMIAAAAAAPAEKPKRKYTRKTAAKPAETKAAPAAKRGRKKSEDKIESAKSVVMLQFSGNDYDIEKLRADVEADVKAKFKGKVKKLDIYIKPEEHAVYYAVNDKGSEEYKLSI